VDTSGGKLDALQKRVLESLATIQPPFILGDGAALAGVYLAHRQTRDLDLSARFALDRHPIQLRIAGLDRNPGWQPAEGRSFAFVFE